MNILLLDHNDCVLYRTAYFEEKEEEHDHDVDESKNTKATVVINPHHDQNHEVMCSGYNA
jgi:hypothetical protein